MVTVRYPIENKCRERESARRKNNKHQNGECVDNGRRVDVYFSPFLLFSRIECVMASVSQCVCVCIAPLHNSEAKTKQRWENISEEDLSFWRKRKENHLCGGVHAHIFRASHHWDAVAVNLTNCLRRNATIKNYLLLMPLTSNENKWHVATICVISNRFLCGVHSITHAFSALIGLNSELCAAIEICHFIRPHAPIVALLIQLLQIAKFQIISSRKFANDKCKYY